MVKSIDKQGPLLLLFLAAATAAVLLGKLLILALPLVVLMLLAGWQQPKLLFFILLFTIPLSTEFQITTALGTDLPDEPLLWLLTPLLGFMIIRQWDTMRLYFSQPIIKILLLSLSWTLISVLYSELPIVSVKYFLAKIWYILPFVFGTLFFLNSRSSVKQAAVALLLPMVFAVLFIMARHGLEAFSFDSVNEVTKPFFRNHVNYGALLVCLMPVAFAMYRNGSSFWLLVLAIMAAGLVLSFSRGAWLALAFSLVVVYFVRKRMLQWLIIALSVAVIGGSAWLLHENRYLSFRPLYERTIYHESFNDHMEATYNMQDLSTMERFYRWIAAVNMAKEHWIIGTGPNSFYPVYKSYTVTGFTTYVSNNPEKSTAHNYFLLLMAEQGLPGLILFVALFITMLMTAQRIYHQTEDGFVKGLMLVISAMLGMIAVLIFLSDLIETDKIGSMFYICVGLLVAAASGSYVERVPQAVAKQVE